MQKQKSSHQVEDDRVYIIGQTHAPYKKAVVDKLGNDQADMILAQQTTLLQNIPKEGELYKLIDRRSQYLKEHYADVMDQLGEDYQLMEFACDKGAVPVSIFKSVYKRAVIQLFERISSRPIILEQLETDYDIIITQDEKKNENLLSDGYQSLLTYTARQKNTTFESNVYIKNSSFSKIIIPYEKGMRCVTSGELTDDIFNLRYHITVVLMQCKFDYLSMLEVVPLKRQMIVIHFAKTMVKQSLQYCGYSISSTDQRRGYFFMIRVSDGKINALNMHCVENNRQVDRINCGVSVFCQFSTPIACVDDLLGKRVLGELRFGVHSHMQCLKSIPDNVLAAQNYADDLNTARLKLTEK